MSEPRSDGGEPVLGAPPRTPWWVKVLGVALAQIVVLVAVRLLTGGDLGGHGPGLHSG